MDSWTTHNWVGYKPREITIDGVRMHQEFCLSCYRDFAKETTEQTWRAVNVTLLRFRALDDEVSERWITQQCPRRILVSDADDRRTCGVLLRGASIEDRAVVASTRDAIGDQLASKHKRPKIISQSRKTRVLEIAVEAA